MGKTLQIKKLEGALHGLERELEQLAPHPGHYFTPACGLTAGFNFTSMRLQACLRDMPRRAGLERRLSTGRRRLAALRAAAWAETPALAA